MSRGTPITKEKYYQIKGMLKTGFKTKAIAEQTGVGTHSITRVNTTENYEEFLKKK